MSRDWAEISTPEESEESEEIKKSLRANTMSRNWAEIIKIFKEHPKFYATKITKSGDTALHVAITHGADNTLVQLLNAMEERDRVATKKALKSKNEQGDTPLHYAAARSSPSSPTMFDRILSIDRELVVDRNNEGETPLFLAALHGHKETFLYLHSVAKKSFPSMMTSWRKKEGETILHCTIQREYFDLAFTIIHLYKDQHIASRVDENGITPLHVLASKPSAFERSTSLRWWTKILYYFMVVEPLKIPVTAPIESEELHVKVAPQNQSQDSHALMISGESKDKKRTTLFNKAELPENYHICHDFFEFLWDLVRRVNSKDAIGRNSEREARDSTSHENSFFQLNYATCFEFFKSSYISILVLSGIGVMDIKKIKQKHVWCTQIMKELVKQNSEYDWKDGGNPLKDRSDEDDEKSAVEVQNKRKTNSSHTDLTNANGAQQNQPEREDQSDEDDQESSWLETINKRKTNSSRTDLTNANGAQQNQPDTQPKGMDQIFEALLTKLSKPKQDLVQEERDKKMTALLTATKYGVIDMVEGILERIPVAIHDKTIEGKNILHVAVENRQPLIFDGLKKRYDWANLVDTSDVNGNNVLHLAAKVSRYKPWQIPGSALQMQWEIKWYEYVIKEVESKAQHLIFQTNKDDDTPGEIFNESHKQLVKEASEWLKSTSESCSVVAALIAGVSFATSSQVPGGNSSSGEPNFKGQPAFNIFAMTSLVSLCFSITALVMFLAILTSRQQPKDFRRDLPFKLLLGLSSLFVSITSILVSFCAAYFFVLREKLSNGLYIIYCATCLPVSFYAVAQFPLYLDLLKSIFTGVPQPSYKDDDS